MPDKYANISLRHSDFSTHNIFINEQGVHVLDFTTSLNNYNYYDVCDFWYSLQFMKHDLFKSSFKVNKLQSVFLESYGSDLDDGFFKILSFQFILTRLVSVHTLLKKGDLKWYEKINYKFIYIMFINDLN